MTRRRNPADSIPVDTTESEGQGDWNNPFDPPPLGLVVEIKGVDSLQQAWIVKVRRANVPLSRKWFWVDLYGRPIVLNRPTGWRYVEAPRKKSLIARFLAKNDSIVRT